MMRVTNQMLDAVAKKAGITLQRTSLLDYVNNDSSNMFTSSALTTGNITSSVRKECFEKLEETADQLLEKINFFTAEGTDSIFEKARQSGNLEEIQEGVEAFVDAYNDMRKELKNTSSPLNDFYREMMQEAVSENNEAFSKLGITISRDGSLKIDQDRLKTADVDSLEKLLGNTGTFSAKMAFLATRISDNAQENVQSFSSQYNYAGNLYSALSSKYDFWG